LTWDWANTGVAAATMAMGASRMERRFMSRCEKE
jgi:hypothetical protein